MPRPLKYTILIDNREKRPLTFPDAITILDPNTPAASRTAVWVHLDVPPPRQLKTADYVLGEDKANVFTLGRGAVVERKFTLDEIATNLFVPRRRRLFVDQLKRMREAWDHPVLVFEGGLQRLYTPTKHVEDPGVVVSSLLRLGFEYGISILPIPSTTTAQRRLLAEHVAQILVNGALVHAAA